MSKLDDYLADVEARYEAATPGPWWALDDGSVVADDARDSLPVAADVRTEEDLIFVVHARSDVPALLGMLWLVLADATNHDARRCRHMTNPDYACDCGAEELRKALVALIPQEEKP